MGSAGFRVDRDDPEELKVQFAMPFNLSLLAAVVMSDGAAPAPGVSVVLTFTSETGPTGRTLKIDAGRVLQFTDMIPGI